MKILRVVNRTGGGSEYPMKHWAFIAVVILTAALLSGCEWTGGSETTTWNDSVSWVDFSGVYRDGGAIMVSQFGSSGGWTNLVGSTNTASERLGTGNGVTTMFNGSLAHRPLPGSLTIVAGAYVLSDSEGNSPDGSASLSVNVADGTEGSINYASAQYTVRFAYPLASDTRIFGSYTYEIIDDSDSGSGQGNHGSPIYSFTIYQQGSTLILIDSNGDRYDGQLGSVRVTGASPANPVEGFDYDPPNGPVVAQFSATGVANGYQVTIVGTLQGNRADNVFNGRAITGTYIEEGGYQANVNGAAAEIAVSSQ